MTKYSKYVVESGRSKSVEKAIGSLQDSVLKRMAGNYQPIGGVSIVYDKDYDEFVAAQAMGMLSE